MILYVLLYFLVPRYTKYVRIHINKHWRVYKRQKHKRDMYTK